MIINTIAEELTAGPVDMQSSTENMYLMLLDQQWQVDEFLETIKQKYTHPPRTIIYIGNGCWELLHEALDDYWQATPVLLFAEVNYTGPDIYPLTARVIPHELRQPLNEAVTSPNTTVVPSPVYPAETIRLMLDADPGIKKLMFLSDQRWISAELREQMKEIMATQFPSVQLTFLTEGEISTDAMFDSLRRADETTGLLYFSWVQKNKRAGNTIVNIDAYRVMCQYTDRPIYTLRDIGVEDCDMTGGYFPPKAATSQRVRNLLDGLLNGVKGKQLERFTGIEPLPVLNHRALTDAGIDTDNLPGDTFFYWKPPSTLAQYRYFIAGIIFSFVILLLVIYILILNRQAQRRQIGLMSSYRNLFNNMPVAYLEIELKIGPGNHVKDYIIKDANPCFARQFIAAHQLRGKRGSEAHWEQDQHILDLYAKVCTSHKEITYQYYFARTDTHFQIIAAPSQKPSHVDLFFIDCTELVRAQQTVRVVNHKLAMSLEVANIVPWQWDLKTDTILCDVNKPVELMGSKRIQEDQLTVPSEEYFGKIYKDDREKVRQAYEALISGSIENMREEYRVIVHEGHKTRFEWVEVQATVDKTDDHGHPTVLIGSSLVITARKQMEHELISAKEKAEESNRLKSAFLANMSHEIRTPLNAIVGFSNLIATAEEEQERQEYVSIIENNNTLLLQLISDILDLSKIEAGTLEFVYTDVDLNKLIDELVQAARMRSTSDRVEIVSGERLPDCFVRTEKNRLTQVLTNLTTNAIKFTQEGSITIGYRLTDDGQMLRFYVRDTGCGIPREKQSDIFGRFVKLNDFSQGTGLGLSICQTIVEHAGGRIGVESEEGKGSNFWFTLPYRPVARKAAEDKLVEPEAIERDKLVVLIAEDNPDNFKLFSSILGKEYNILHAWNGREAVELFRKHRPHIVLMDINMPEMNGYEATAEIRKLSDKVPIIAVTAYAYAADEERIMQSGFDAYTPKPLNAQKLRTQILELLRHRLVFI
ncbi:MAG: response regulator [Rikenellaceae bacterium]|nr:response regulator [Rikenellaceae bacterium]